MTSSKVWQKQPVSLLFLFHEFDFFIIFLKHYFIKPRKAVPGQKVHQTCRREYCHPSYINRAKKKERESSISSRRSLDCKTEAKTIQFLLMLYGQSCHPKPLQGQKETFSMYWMAELYSIESRGLEGRQPIRISVDYTAAM